MIDEIRIEGEEDGWHLVIHSEGSYGEATQTRYRIGLPDQFKTEVDRTIGAWLDEGERARASMPTASGSEKRWTPNDLWLDRDEPYEITDPKHPRYGELD